LTSVSSTERWRMNTSTIGQGTGSLAVIGFNCRSRKVSRYFEKNNTPAICIPDPRFSENVGGRIRSRNQASRDVDSFESPRREQLQRISGNGYGLPVHEAASRRRGDAASRA